MIGASLSQDHQEIALSFRDSIRVLRKQAYEPSERRSQSLEVAQLSVKAVIGLVERRQQTVLLRVARCLRQCMDSSMEEVTSHEVNALLDEVVTFGLALQRCTPMHFQILIANVIRRSLAILRDAAEEARLNSKQCESAALALIGEFGDDASDAEDDDRPKLRGSTGSFSGEGSPEPLARALPRSASTCDAFVLGGNENPVDLKKFFAGGIRDLQEYFEETNGMTQAMCETAAHQVVENETVLTTGCTHSTLNFLMSAARTKKFHLIVLHGDPLEGAAKLVKELKPLALSTQLLPDSSVFAVMPHASKVVISCETVLANGGVLAPIGTHMVCVAAKHFRAPVVVVTMTLKMCPYYPSDAACSSLVRISRKKASERPWSAYAFPGAVVPLTHVETSEGTNVLVPSITMEYVPPDLIDLFATNGGEFTVPQIHNTLREYYAADDYHV